MKYISFVLIGIVCFQGLAQNYFDIANISYTNTPSNDFEVSESQTTVEELALELNFPVVINEKTILLTGFFTNKTKVKLDTNIPSHNLNVLGLNVGINKTLNDTWSTTFMLFSKIASDEIKLSKNNHQIAFLSLFTKKKRSDLKYRYGVYANTEKYGLIVVPIFGVYYLSNNKKFEANLNLPIIGDLNYRLNEKSWAGMRFDGLGTTYNLNNQNYSPNGAYVSKTSNELVGYFRYKLSKSLYVSAKAGYAIVRNYKVFDSEDKIDLALTAFYLGDNRTQLNERFKDGAIFKVELLYRLHFD
ncbi:DUF6268 family outer membrane beta-barrel protein [Flavisericum labens]|uniref:DUF6268 family outer membrane beta-barrel protein n=1 Tax=Flavisericum labens TaxID=3377112 RepID=UPI00387B9698